MKTGVRTRPIVVALNRTELLYWFWGDLLKELGEHASIAEILRLGIERELLLSSTTHFLNENGNAVASVTMTIDWAQHRLLLSKSDKQVFVPATDKPLALQLQASLPVLVDYVRQVWHNHSVHSVRTQFVLTISKELDPNGYANALKTLGLVEGSAPNWEPGQRLKWQPPVQEFPELQLVFRSV